MKPIPDETDGVLYQLPVPKPLHQDPSAALPRWHQVTTINGQISIMRPVEAMWRSCVHCSLTSDKELVDRKDYYGKTPLYWAAYKGQRASMELLLQHGANVNSCCKHGGTPLHAAIGLFPDCALLLIQHGADVNLQDNWGVTPMYLAACSGQLECIRLLVQAGADITYKNKKTGLPPKRLASQVGFIAWIESCSHQPRSLKHLSRLQIRSSLGPQRLKAVRTFNLPQSLKCYLMFEDLVLQETL